MRQLWGVLFVLTSLLLANCSTSSSLIENHLFDLFFSCEGSTANEGLATRPQFQLWNWRNTEGYQGNFILPGHMAFGEPVEITCSPIDKTTYKAWTRDELDLYEMHLSCNVSSVDLDTFKPWWARDELELKQMDLSSDISSAFVKLDIEGAFSYVYTGMLRLSPSTEYLDMVEVVCQPIDSATGERLIKS